MGFGGRVSQLLLLEEYAIGEYLRDTPYLFRNVSDVLSTPLSLENA